MKTDLDIAKAANIQHIDKIAEKLNINKEYLEHYGKYKAKLPLHLINEENSKNSKLVLVTAITPTPAGEGKTTTSIGISDGLNKIGKKSIVVLREPSLGPVFGIKGGATGGGYSQIIPMEDINLHFTGDLSAIEKSHNLLSALLDNNIQNKNSTLNIDARTVRWKRVMDMNDRALRNIVIGLGGKTQGVPRESGFDITAASEVMAILCLAKDLGDLKTRLGNIYLADSFDGTPIYAKDLKAQGAMASLLKDAIKPNLVQSLEGNPAIIHGGPFANIAQGTNSILATKMGLSLADYVITEAGFASELGAEKFFDIKSQYANLKPNASVIVATVRALKYHGGADLKELSVENIDALAIGLDNLEKHIENIKHFGINPIVAINKFESDTNAEIDIITEKVKQLGVTISLNDSWAKGGDGSIDIANKIVEEIDKNQNNFAPIYSFSDELEYKIEIIAKKIYGANNVEYSAKAKKDIKKIKELDLDKLAVCIAKTQKSISDKPNLKNRPSNFTLNIIEIEIASGAGFVIPIAGNIMRMPGLPSFPAAEKIDIDDDGNIYGLF